MGSLKDFLTPRHVGQIRDYSSRAMASKPQWARIAQEFGVEYWDGGRNTGYGGYRDDGRWLSIAKRFADEYRLTSAKSVLDIGCGKGFFLSALSAQIPALEVSGLDISAYAINCAPKTQELRLHLGSAHQLPFSDSSFDLVVAMNTLHNLKLPELVEALREIVRVGRGPNAYVCVESFRNEEEKWNLMRWQLTCQSFFSPREWLWIFSQAGYEGDYEFIYFS